MGELCCRHSIFQRTEHIQYDHTSGYVKLCQHTTSEKPEFNLSSYITEVIFYLNCSREFSDKRNEKNSILIQLKAI